MEESEREVKSLDKNEGSKNDFRYETYERMQGCRVQRDGLCTRPVDIGWDGKMRERREAHQNCLDRGVEEIMRVRHREEVWQTERRE